MFLDALLQVSDGQALTATAVCTNTIDLGAEKPEIGDGEQMGFVVSVDVAADATTGDETYEVDVISDDSAALGSPNTIAKYVIAAAALTAGSLHFFPIPPGFPADQYLGLKYVLGGTTPGITVSAWLIPQSLFALLAKSYPRNYSV